ncbi:hypothetical protein ABUW04_08765 [Streptacidiphilus sp. N1-10]|uniref:Neocarzinostatin family protein n=1 Tax=Streptacidiphilus jeojiensis TaxID=3229225 RepID=A0ABV6XJA6_9ACTN
MTVGPLPRLAALLAGALLLALALPVLLPQAPARAAGTGATVKATPGTAAPGATATVLGTGWPVNTPVTVLLCGQNAVNGTDSCANATGRALTTSAGGGFAVQLAVVKPPQPCPCVIHATTVTGANVTVDTPFPVIGVASVPIKQTPGTMLPLTASISGGGSLMTWFGAPPHRTFKAMIANVGNSAITDPVFRMGTTHSVYSPDWQEYQWSGVIAPGGRQEIDVPLDFAAGAHGGYSVELDYAGTELTVQQVSLPQPWGVTLFWLLLCVVVPVGLFRTGLAVVDRVRPDPDPAPAALLGRARRRAAPGGAPGQEYDTLALPPMPAHPPRAAPLAPTLPWFAPGSGPVLPKADDGPAPADPLVRTAQARTPGSSTLLDKGIDA